MALKLKFPEARHIVAVWNLPTDEKYDGQFYCEDEEYGVGEPILKYLIEQNINSSGVIYHESMWRKVAR